MFQIKICGVKTVADAKHAIDAGADALGLNFYPRSRRYITPEAGEAIVAEAMATDVTTVGVFVNSAPSEIRDIADRLQLDAVQLHGDEPPEDIAALESLRVIRAFRGQADIARHVEYLDRCRALGALPAAVLFDAYDPHHFGGAGKLADWEAARAMLAALNGIPLVLAGGLTPENVAQAIEAVLPAGVDVASGVEDAAGSKDAKLCHNFVHAARAAIERVGGRPCH